MPPASRNQCLPPWKPLGDVLQLAVGLTFLRGSQAADHHVFQGMISVVLAKQYCSTLGSWISPLWCKGMMYPGRWSWILLALRLLRPDPITCAATLSGCERQHWDAETDDWGYIYIYIPQTVIVCHMRMAGQVAAVATGHKSFAVPADRVSWCRGWNAQRRDCHSTAFR